MTQRLREWQSLLADCLAQRAQSEFAWGSHDCCLFAADCVDACTGTDPAADLRGTYSTAAEAMQLVESLGGLGAIAAARLGPEVPPALAQPGDVGLLINADREMLAVWGGSMWLAPAEVGWVALPLEQATRAWRITAAEEA